MGQSPLRDEAELNWHLRQLTRAGHGVVTNQELIELGLSVDMIKSRKRAGRLVPVLRAVSALPGTVLTDRGRWRSAVCSAGGQACLSHRSALALHGLVREKGPVHVTRTAGSGPSRSSRFRSSGEFEFSVECHRTRQLPENQVTEVDGIPVTTVERSLRDFAAIATEVEISKALSQGERERVLCWQTLGVLLDSSKGHRGVGGLRRAVSEWDPTLADTQSDPEEDLLNAIRARGLPTPMVNVPLDPYIADFYWPELRLVVELDPYGTHKGRESFNRDHRKSVELEARGLRVIRVTGDDLYLHLDRTLSELEVIIEEQRRLHG